MSAYLSNLLTQTTSKYNSLRRTLLSSEDDGDTEDDTNVCRVLRAYYTEKGRSFPSWLPPDPNDRKSLPSTTPSLYSNQSSYFSGSAGYPTNAPSNRANLSDLWDAPAAPAQVQPTSLRNTRRPGSNAAQPPPQQAPRPLPSQRAGSYQNANAGGPPPGRQQQQQQPSYMSAHAMSSRPPAPSSVPSTASTASSLAPGGVTAQDRLKARLWGARGGAGGGAGTPSPPASSVGAANP